MLTLCATFEISIQAVSFEIKDQQISLKNLLLSSRLVRFASPPIQEKKKQPSLEIISTTTTTHATKEAFRWAFKRTRGMILNVININEARDWVATVLFFVFVCISSRSTEHLSLLQPLGFQIALGCFANEGV